MCGVVGFLSPGGFAGERAGQEVMQMANSLTHRGPDDAGQWIDANAGIALAHRRLSILDLSPAGHQPMHSASGRYVLVFNGEIYNHLELRRKVEGLGYRDWRGGSDTETLLVAIDAWGLVNALQESIGMFALALWDRKSQCLSLARDRMGEKPIYYGWQGDTVLFGSELKALRHHPMFRSEIDRDVLPLYLRHGYIPAPWSIWKGIRKLTPGCLVQFSGCRVGEIPSPVPYWSLTEAIAAGQANPFSGSDDDAIDSLEQKLREAVAAQMVADVPLGAFLSGGIDSTTVVALMQSQSNRPVKTFTIGFDNAGYNEAEFAKAVAVHLGTDHTELYVNAVQAREVVSKLPAMYDEPFGDPSAIPTYLVSQLARQHVTVSLSGDGGDELFGGYPHYAESAAIWASTRRVPLYLRSAFGGLLTALPECGGATKRQTMTLASAVLSGANLITRAKSLGQQMAEEDLIAFFDFRRAVYRNPERLFQKRINGRLPWPQGQTSKTSSPIVQMMAYDALGYLPDDILVKVDRASMAVGLESRAPLLDHRLVEFVARLPLQMKIRGRTGKWILRELLYRHVPRALVDRKKAGFGVPIDSWLRGPFAQFWRGFAVSCPT
jgi:asparagine synthase (glutamine-hydrolysing)